MEENMKNEILMAIQGVNIKVNYIVWFDYSLLNWILRYYCVPTDYRINTLSPYYIKYFNKLQMQMYIIRKRYRGLF